jgi:hypothetical protein
MLKISIVAAVLFFQIMAVQADMTLVQQYSSIAGGKKGMEYTVITYYTADKMKTVDSRGPATIVDLIKQQRIGINHKSKSFGIQPLDDWAAAQKRVPFGFGEFELKINITNDTEIIDGRNCAKIEMDMGGIHRVVWVSADIKPDNAAIEFNKKYGSMFKDSSLIASEKEIWETYCKLGAFPIKTVDKLDPPFASTMTTTYKSHNYKKIAPSLFDPPEGYTGHYALGNWPKGPAENNPKPGR